MIGSGTAGRQLEIYNANDAYMKFNGVRAGNNAFTIGNDNSGFVIYDDTNATYRLRIANNTGAATFTNSIAATSATFSDLLTIISNGGTKAVWATTRAFGVNRNFQLAVDEYVEGAFTITPSTTEGGSTYTTPIFRLAATGAATFSGSATFGSDVFTYANGGIFFNGGGSYGSGIFQQSGGNLILQTGTTPRLTIASTGAATFSSSVSGTSIRSSAVGSFGFNTANNGEFQIYGTATDGMLIAGRGSTNDLVLLNKNGSDVLRVPTGTTTVSLQSLTGSGSRAVLADASGNLSAPVSDISVKENIKTIGYGLNEILKMNPVWFDFIDEYKNYGQGRQNGNIAQDMETIIPEAVFITPSTGKMGINYDQLHAVYIKAIQELKAELDELKNK
jgi:hypothetical protein